MSAVFGSVAMRRIDPEADRELHLLVGARVCSLKQKHAVLWKYRPILSGVTLYTAMPVTGAPGLVARR